MTMPRETGSTPNSTKEVGIVRSPTVETSLSVALRAREETFDFLARHASRLQVTNNAEEIALQESERAIARLGERVAQSDKATDDNTNTQAGIAIYLTREGVDALSRYPDSGLAITAQIAPNAFALELPNGGYVTGFGGIQCFKNVTATWGTTGGGTDPFILAYSDTLRIESMAPDVSKPSLPSQIWQNYHFTFEGAPISPVEQ